tara:strand:- start:216 stop:1202 length:987 start_codon:yes stop_codon:yes gene_type:complete
MEKKFKYRDKCPICESTKFKFFCNLNNEYLFSSKSGWCTDEEILKNAGFDLDKEINCSYYKCENCKSYFLRELYDMENAFQNYYTQNPNVYEKEINNNSRMRTIKFIQRSDIINSSLTLAANLTNKESLNVLDFGCGGGHDLTIAKSLRVKKAVGYNFVSFPFKFVKQSNIEIKLTDNLDEVKKNSPYDFVICNSVLEHVYNPNLIMKQIDELIEKNSVVFFYAPCVSDKEMNINAEKIKKAEKVKTLHPGHVQVWNYNGLSLSEYVKGKNYRIIPLRINDEFIDLSSSKNLIFKIKSQLINIIKYSYDYLSIKNNNFKRSFFLAVKK